MKLEIETASNRDAAAIFACAISLWKACHDYGNTTKDFNLAECFKGMDQLMRIVMAIGSRFEDWACRHVNFYEFNDVWPYLLENKFGETCLAWVEPNMLQNFDENDCLRIALKLQLPVIVDGKLPIPLEITAPNPQAGNGFLEFKIQTVRDKVDEDEDIVPFTADDDPFDPEFGGCYFALYGIGADGLLEHIADRKNYSDAFHLAQKLAPGIEFPSRPTFISKAGDGEANVE